MTCPLSHKIANTRSFPSPCSLSLYDFSSHAFLTDNGSFVQGLESMTAFVNIFKPDKVRDSGPSTDRIESCPSNEFAAPSYGIRP